MSTSVDSMISDEAKAAKSNTSEQDVEDPSRLPVTSASFDDAPNQPPSLPCQQDEYGQSESKDGDLIQTGGKSGAKETQNGVYMHALAETQHDLAKQVTQLSTAIEKLASHLGAGRSSVLGGTGSNRSSGLGYPRTEGSLEEKQQPYDTDTAEAAASVSPETTLREFIRYFVYFMQKAYMRRVPGMVIDKYPKILLLRSRGGSGNAEFDASDAEVPEEFDFQDQSGSRVVDAQKHKNLVKALRRVVHQWPVNLETGGRVRRWRITHNTEKKTFRAFDDFVFNNAAIASLEEDSELWDVMNKVPEMYRGSLSLLELEPLQQTLTLKNISTISWRLLSGLLLIEELQDRSVDPDEPKLVVMKYICHFCRPFDYEAGRNQSFGPWNAIKTVVPSIPVFGHLHFSMRCLSMAFRPRSDKQGEESGFGLSRESGNLVLNGDTAIAESRTSVFMLARYTAASSDPDSDSPPAVLRYNVLALFDFGGKTAIRSQGLRPNAFMIIEKHGIQIHKESWTPVVVFIACFMSMLPDWYMMWAAFLDALDSKGTQTISVSSLLNKEQLRSMLWDSSSVHAESHFQISNILRVAVYWIRETQEQFKLLGKKTFRLEKEESPVARFWTAAEKDLASYANDILQRIEQKSEETKGLREGFYSANALREASRSTQVNEYLFVFTLMTILYLPLTFVATLYGNSIDFFDFTDPSQQAAFGSAMGVVSLGTYIASFSLIWMLRRSSRRQSAQRLWKQFLDVFDITRLWKAKGAGDENKKTTTKEASATSRSFWDFKKKLRFRGRNAAEKKKSSPVSAV